jgi:hypothetical protein
VTTTRWLTGAALCPIAVLVLTNPPNPFGGNDRLEVASPPTIASIDDDPTQESGKPRVAARPDNLPGQPPYEASALTVRPAEVQQEKFSAPSPPPEPIEDPTETQSAAVLQVYKKATLRALHQSLEDRNCYPRYCNPCQGARRGLGAVR